MARERRATVTLDASDRFLIRDALAAYLAKLDRDEPDHSAIKARIEALIQRMQ